MEIPMSVLTKNGDVYADVFGFAVSRIRSFWEITEAVFVEAFELRARLMKEYGTSQW